MCEDGAVVRSENSRQYPAQYFRHARRLTGFHTALDHIGFGKGEIKADKLSRYVTAKRAIDEMGYHRTRFTAAQISFDKRRQRIIVKMAFRRKDETGTGSSLPQITIEQSLYLIFLWGYVFHINSRLQLRRRSLRDYLLNFLRLSKEK